ncbi:helix-turn-helix transcriptional regulator [Streptomyces lavendulae]|uniref:helix-turn-helix transcriptional regulator n=1 Tax=Streptomyces lavendulae TaxID=1914 RepID=UPI0033D6E965
MARNERRCSRCDCSLSRYNAEPMCAACIRTAADDMSAGPHLPHQVWRDAEVAEAMSEWDFGRAFRRIREIASLRQEDMAELTGLSQSFLSTLESGGRRLANIDKIISVLSRLQVPPDVAPRPVQAGMCEPQMPSLGQPALAVPAWESPVEIAKRLNAATASNVDSTALLLLEQGVAEIVERYEGEGPYQLVTEAVELRSFIQRLMDGRQPPERRRSLFRLAAQASGLLGYMAVNAGRESLAEAYCSEAQSLAEEIRDVELIMWTYGTRSLNAYYAGRYEAAVQWADVGLAIDPGHPQAIRLHANGRARALGKLNHRAEAERSIATAEDLSSKHSTPPILTSCISFEAYGTARTLANVATVHVSLGNAQRVLEYADQIDELVEQSESAWSRALVRLDVATALLAGPRPEVEHAMVLGRQVLEGGGGPPIRSVVQRAGELYARTQDWRDLPAVGEYGEALRSWQDAPRARHLAKSAKIERPVGQLGGAGRASVERPWHVSSHTPAQRQ